MLSPAATTAQRVFSAVKCLDIEKFRVRETLEVVVQVAELKTCIPEEIIHRESAEEIVPSVEVPDLPSAILECAAELLCRLFLWEFEHVAEAADEEMVTRFFKLFPLGVAARARDTLAAKRQAGANGAVEADTQGGVIIDTFRDERSIDGKLDESPSDLSSLLTSHAFSSNPPYITSTVNDVMYIANSLIQSALHSSQQPSSATQIPPLAES
ncbi:hypothetical protein B9Z19DRAFT_1121714 [Tuber borchii]|uniref:Conserved oligomeric Golgi complex subunit 4 N-terminal domain-containing protein n=1 Tax=Tuber borchii TaxID=42251 RepID=A0A2T7A251_TUBBO|nr:hypothetical protein B9Z19DRAFT_1121714 [Tuber borchii]